MLTILRSPIESFEDVRLSPNTLKSIREARQQEDQEKLENIGRTIGSIVICNIADQYDVPEAVSISNQILDNSLDEHPNDHMDIAVAAGQGIIEECVATGDVPLRG